MLDLFLRTDGLVDITTESVQGKLRHSDDIYAGKLEYGDPVFVVSAVVAD